MLYDIYSLMRLNRLVKSHRIKFMGVLAARKLGFRHLSVRFDPISSCNLRCKMCYFSNQEFLDQLKFKKFSWEEVERIAENFFPKAIQLVIGCSYEPTLYKDFPRIAKLAKDHGVPKIDMVTNGQIIKEGQVEELIDVGLNELILSMHGTSKEVYEELMPGAKHEKFMKLLETVTRLKRDKKAKTPKIRINYTVNEKNIGDLENFFEVCGDYDIGMLQVRPVMNLGGKIDGEEFSDSIQRYNSVVRKLRAECEQRNVQLFSNEVDPGYVDTEQDYYSVIVDAVHRSVKPECVWRADFDWKNETYDEYLDRTDWNQKLIKAISYSKEKVIADNPWRGTLTGRYS